MHYETIKLDKSMYQREGGFSAQLEKLDPSAAYAGGDLAGLDAFQRQLKRFDIKVSGPASDMVGKFFSTSDSPPLFPEYVTRAVTQGAREVGILEQIIASATDINALDYRSIMTKLENNDLVDNIFEGGYIPEVEISLNDHVIRLQKRGRLLSASYEAIRFQRLDVITVALRQIGVALAKAQLRDAAQMLIHGDEESVPAADLITSAEKTIAYADLLKLWNLFEDFDMNVLLVSPDMAMDILSLEEFRGPLSGANAFQNSGAMATPMGAQMIKTSAVPEGYAIGLDKRFALELVTAGGITVEHDKLINTQIERTAVTSIYGFSKIFPDAVKVLERKY